MVAYLLHGVPDTGDEWRRVRSHLGRSDVVAPDMPGFGCATPDGWTATKDEYASWLVDQLERFDDSVDIVGHDWGALLVQRVLELRPDLLRTCAFGGAVVHPSYVWHDTAQLFQTAEVGEQIVAAMTPEAMAAGLPASGVPADVAAEVGTRIDDAMRACILALYRSARDVVNEWTLPSPSPVPTLVICGADDPYVSRTHHEAAAETTGAQLLVLEGCNHWWPLERPTDVATALEHLWANGG